jgi:hypothetical protein
MKAELQRLIDTRLNNPQEQLDVCDFEALFFFQVFFSFLTYFLNKL